MFTMILIIVINSIEMKNSAANIKDINFWKQFTTILYSNKNLSFIQPVADVPKHKKYNTTQNDLRS